ncbi:hypothetical protein FQA39_LY04943 [Lamprigera yunnana]|nr:hypothetical protein FQA39_LY04943 [Lamprigera yunnana]
MNRIDLSKLTSDQAYALIPSDRSHTSESEGESKTVNLLYERSEDELPLQRNIVSNEEQSLKWNKNISSSTNVQQFMEPVGPNLQDNLEYPIDVFRTLFSENLLKTSFSN